MVLVATSVEEQYCPQPRIALGEMKIGAAGLVRQRTKLDERADMIGVA